jgi:CheY-like chemotaxis protein
MKPTDRDNAMEAARNRLRLLAYFDELADEKPRGTAVPIRATAGPLVLKWLVRTDPSVKPKAAIPLLTVTHALGVRGEASARLLIVEDDPDAAAALAEALAETGYDVAIAGDGRDAFDRVHNAGLRPDLILLDLLMPVMDGLTFLAARASDPLLADVPVIVLSGYRAAGSPADVFARVDKPIALLVLLDAVERALGGATRTRPAGS